MAELFDTTKQNISLHIKNIFDENELNENSVVKENLTIAKDGKKYKTKFYNLELIISVGYRVKSVRGTQFRIWANKLIKEYLIKGYNLNVDRFKNNGGEIYFEELLKKIRDIRSSEKVFWRKILDIYATSVDYDARDEKTKEFFWNMFIADSLVGNFDRHNGKWGFLINESLKKIEIAPIYDCASCLYPQLTDEKIAEIINNDDEMKARVYVFTTSLQLRYERILEFSYNKLCR